MGLAVGTQFDGVRAWLDLLLGSKVEMSQKPDPLVTLNEGANSLTSSPRASPIFRGSTGSYHFDHARSGGGPNPTLRIGPVAGRLPPIHWIPKSPRMDVAAEPGAPGSPETGPRLREPRFDDISGESSEQRNGRGHPADLPPITLSRR